MKKTSNCMVYIEKRGATAGLSSSALLFGKFTDWHAASGTRIIKPTLKKITLRALVIFVCVALCLPMIAQETAKNRTAKPISKADRDHWSFRPLYRPVFPPVTIGQPARHPIDRFISARFAREGIRPLPPVDRATLVRRVVFDLTGLPPTPSQIDRFVADNSPDAYERLIDRVLASPRHGEQFAQDWLDLARFAETDGYEHDLLRATAWKYRDWVIRALNFDMPYDQFVAMQLAGDESTGGEKTDREAAAIATMFCLAGPDMPDINSQHLRKHDLMNEMTGTVGSVFLGLQFGCAQCHSHKFDPISIGDFYRLRAFFENDVTLRKNKSVTVLKKNTNNSAPGRVWIRGDHRRPGAIVSPDFPRIANLAGSQFETKNSATARTQLARWITDSRNPLTARVMANRIWQHHFGSGLCTTPSDFGAMGQPPSHPALLDFLATELIRSGWSMKRLHRLIVTSSAYQRASRGTPDSAHYQTALEKDPDNLLLWRFSRLRLSGEAIRDAMLATSDSLSTRTGGPGVRPPLPKEVQQTLLNKSHWQLSSDREDHFRRSVYVFARRNLRYPVFEAFDRPDANATCSRRNRSTTAPQSLLLLNSRFALDAARRMAGYVLKNGGDQRSRIQLVYRRMLGRSATRAELNIAAEFLVSQAKLIRSQGRGTKNLALPEPMVIGVESSESAALVDYCLAMFNLSEFLYVD